MMKWHISSPFFASHHPIENYFIELEISNIPPEWTAHSRVESTEWCIDKFLWTCSSFQFRFTAAKKLMVNLNCLFVPREWVVSYSNEVISFRFFFISFYSYTFLWRWRRNFLTQNPLHKIKIFKWFTSLYTHSFHSR